MLKAFQTTAFGLVEYTIPPYLSGPELPGARPAALYILDGMLAVTRGDETLTATRGQCVLVPGDVALSCWNPASEPAAFLLVYGAGGGGDDETRPRGEPP